MFLTTTLRQSPTHYMRRLFVGNLSWITSEHQIRDYFVKFGGVRSVKLFFNKQTGLSRQFAFVDFKTNDGASAALAKLSHTLDGRDISINLAIRNTNRRFNDKPENGQTLLDDNNSNTEDVIVAATLEPEIEAANSAVSSPPSA